MWKCHYHFYEKQGGRETRKHKSFTLPCDRYTREQAMAEIHFRRNERDYEGVDVRALGEAFAYFEAMDGSAPTYVYGIMNDRGRCLKIGFSKDPATRLMRLQQSNAYPLRLVFQVHGTIADEKRLHSALEGSISQNEWYRLTPTIKEFLKRVREYDE